MSSGQTTGVPEGVTGEEVAGALSEESRGAGVNIRQANGIGRVHVAKPQIKETYCGRPIDEEDWVTTSKEANCTGCARAGAPRPEDATLRR
jgi:hypothetical protein